MNFIGMEIIDFISQSVDQQRIEKHKIAVIKDLGKDGSFMVIKKSKEYKLPSWESGDDRNL